MKITQVKPIVVWYQRVEFAGSPVLHVFEFLAEDLACVAEMDRINKRQNPTGERSKFRPVYAGNEETVIDRFSEEWV